MEKGLVTQLKLTAENVIIINNDQVRHDVQLRSINDLT